MIYPAGDSQHYLCPQNIVADGKCVGDRCAAWRWHDDLMQRTAAPSVMAGDEEPARPESVPASWKWSPASENDDEFGVWVEPVSEAARRQRGYCGLAGKPEVIE